MAAIEYIGFDIFKETADDSYTVIYKRYLDDILICVLHNVPINDAETYHPSSATAWNMLALVSSSAVESTINFEMTGSAWRIGESVDYLDLKIRIEKDASYRFGYCSVYDKPTNLHIYTDPTTFFPMHYVYSWIQGENIRYIRNSSDEQSYKDSLHLFKEFLFRRKYLEEKVDRYLALNTYEDREALLRGEKPHSDRSTKDKGNNNRKNNYITLENSGYRGIITGAIKLIDNVAANVPANSNRYVPVVLKGKTILTTMNQLRKN